MYSVFLLLLQNNLWYLEQVLMELLFLHPLSHKSTNATSVAAVFVLSFSPFSPNSPWRQSWWGEANN